MYQGGLADAVQLAISINCFTLLLIITVAYFAYYLQTNEKTFLAGGYVTANIMFFVFSETIIIITGWTNNIPLGRQFYRFEQIPILLFLASLPYFILCLFHLKGKIKKFFTFFIWIGICLTFVIGIISYVFPESVISVVNPSKTPSLTPGDFPRGLEGPLFIVRDIMLVTYIVLSLAYSIYYIIRKSRNFQSIAFLTGLVISILGGFDDMQYVYSAKNYFLNGYRFSRFVFGTTIMLLFFFIAVFQKYLMANTLLKKTNHELAVFENKYALLMNATNELMFSLSEDTTIISANSKAKQIFKLDNKKKKFIDCIYHSEYESLIDNNYIQEQLSEFHKSGDTLTTNYYILDPVTKEPSEYQFRFDSFYDDGKLELFGRGWPLKTSKLNEYIKNEKITLNVENYIVMVDAIVDRITINLKNYLDEGDVMMLKMGLQEMIVNAMEHGNLNVTFDEKTKAQEEGRLFDFMKDRRVQPEYRDRKVTIDYYFDDKKVIYRITDMGPGFNYQEIMNRVKREVSQQSLTHGRGIIMTQAVFDSVEYNDKGNQVLLVKKFG